MDRAIMKKMLRNYLLFFLFLVGFSAPVFAVRYVDVSSVKDVPLITVKNIEDFEEIISTYQISIVYRVCTSVEVRDNRRGYDVEEKYNSIKNTLFLMTSGTYFSFFIGEYNTIEDYKAGAFAKYYNGRDFYDAQKLGIEKSDFYYWYSDNHFRSLEDARDAYKIGFFSKKSEDYYRAKELGYTSYTDYDVYCTYTKAGFKTKDEWETAKKAGFTYASTFYKATDAGFSISSEYEAAQKLGLQESKDSYDFYLAITNSIDKIVEKDKLTKKEAFILTLLQTFPKGEMSISVLSSRLQDMVNQKKGVKEAFEKFIFGNSSRNSYGGNYINYSLTPSGLLKFFSTVDISKIGSYDSKTKIFKKTVGASKLLPVAKGIEKKETVKKVFEKAFVGYLSQEAIVEAAAGTGVYWTAHGKVFHLYEDCQSLDRSETLITGSAQEAIDAGKSSICDFCWKKT